MPQDKKSRPARTPEARENQLISLAYDLAEKQLRDGTASSQVITQFLKLASPTERLEREILESRKELMVAKTEAIKSNKNVEKLYQNALNAMKSYRGESSEDEDL
jgi:hypothetical protein